MNARNLQQMHEQIGLLQVQQEAVQKARHSRDAAAQVIYQSAAYDQLVNIGCHSGPAARIAQDVVAALSRGNYVQAQTLLKQLKEQFEAEPSPDRS